MANEVRNQFYTPQTIDCTNLDSLLTGDIWHSDAISTSPTANSQYPYLFIHYSLDWTGAAAGDTAEFYYLRSDSNVSGELWEGNVPSVSSKLTVDADVAAVRDNVVPVHRHVLGATVNQSNQNGVIEIEMPWPKWKLAIYVVGAGIAASGSEITYTYAEPKGV